MIFALLLTISIILSPQAKPDIEILSQENTVVSVEGNTVTLADGTGTEDWFLIDGNEIVF